MITISEYIAMTKSFGMQNAEDFLNNYALGYMLNDCEYYVRLLRIPESNPNVLLLRSIKKLLDSQRPGFFVLAEENCALGEKWIVSTPRYFAPYMSSFCGKKGIKL